MTVNQHGLTRTIPADVKRAVRQRCGFGCVHCGSSFYEYDHIVTEFADAKEHDPDKIVLLCASKHSERTRGAISMETVLRWNAEPKAKSLGYSHYGMDIGTRHPYVRVGNARMDGCAFPIAIELEPLISIDDPEEAGAPYRLSTRFADQDGAFMIEHNEWKVRSDVWDAEVIGPSITIRTGAGRVALKLRVEAGCGIHLEHFDIERRGWRVRTEDGHLVGYQGGIEAARFESFEAVNCAGGISFG